MGQETLLTDRPVDVVPCKQHRRLFRLYFCLLVLLTNSLKHTSVPPLLTGTSTIKVGSMSPTTHPKQHHAAPVDKEADPHKKHHGTSLLACTKGFRPSSRQHTDTQLVEGIRA